MTRIVGIIDHLVIPVLVASIGINILLSVRICGLTSGEKEDVWVDTMDTIEISDKLFVLQKCMKVELFGGVISYFHSTYKEYGEALEVRDSLRETFGINLIIKDFYFNANTVEIIDWERVCTKFSFEEGYSIWILP